jgi:hypothetical protein
MSLSSLANDFLSLCRLTMQFWNLKLLLKQSRAAGAASAKPNMVPTAVAHPMTAIVSGELTGMQPVVSNVELATTPSSVEILLPMVSAPNHRSAAVRDALISVPVREILSRYPPTTTLRVLYPRSKARRS